MKSKYIQYMIVMSAIVMNGCKTPQMTKMPDRVKAEIPTHFQQDSVVGGHAVSAPWQQFFTDSTLISIIDTALTNNQDLRITLQQIVMAKSNVLYQEGQLMPAISA